MKINELKHFFREIECLFKRYFLFKNDKYKEQYEQFHIIKAMHGIEKGLSLKNVKVGFGVPKILNLIKQIENYQRAGYDCSHESIVMAMGAIDTYVQWHKDKNALDERIAAAYDKLQSLIPLEENDMGGFINMTRDEALDFDSKEFEKIMLTRHSLRSFDNSRELDLKAVEEAIELANHCPSACNRQPTKVYIVKDQKNLDHFSQKMEGVGGFAKECQAFLILTGNVSAYCFNENNQWLVSGGIYAGNLVLALHSKGIASCVIQRTLVRSQEIKAFREILDIPENEEIFVAIGIGMYPEEFKAPKSSRLAIDKLIEYR